MQTLMWFVLYVVLILGLATWRSRHDAPHMRRNGDVLWASAAGWSMRQRIASRVAHREARHSQASH